MYEPFDAFEYVDYVRRRWRIVAAACAAALVLSVTVSLLLPKRYTATASIVIEPPGVTDPRNTTTVSPMYLESLKTYERFASSDSLFARAAERFHAGGPSQAIESLKRRVLKVSKIRDTKILEISASFPDPKLAQSFAQYLAEETVNLSRGQSLSADREFIEEAEKQSAEARQRLDRAQQAWNALAVSAPVDALKAELQSSAELQLSLRKQLVDAEANVAEYQQQPEGQFAREQLQIARARASLLAARLQILDRMTQEKSATLASRVAKRDESQSALKLAQSNYETIAARLRDLRAAAGMHSERLRVIDPGIVPQRPSSPNIFLNVSAAVFLALTAAIVYLSVAFAYRRRPVGFEAQMSREMRA